MSQERDVRPAIQGELDCLCGVYSVVNMMSYLFDGKVRRGPLVRTLLREYHCEWSLEDWFAHGLDQPRMDYLIERVLRQGYYQKHFPIQISHPFRERKRLTTKRIFTGMTDYLDRPDFSRLILINDQRHWSVIIRIDSQYLYFFDSSGWQKLTRKSWSLKADTAHQLLPDSIYFVEREF
ncbi:hypothetical protein [Serratia aquatilis]|uniref:Peptidase n=1 Tax=Serratia aquatilis TaxID=1737515 RepID=A0ABV6E875_9GAMM